VKGDLILAKLGAASKLAREGITKCRAAQKNAARGKLVEATSNL